MSAPSVSLPVLRIGGPASGLGPRLKEVWECRELLLFLAWRDVSVRYKQTALGVAWAVLQPTATMVVFSVFFGSLAKMPSDGIPYPVFAYCGLLPWQLFAYALTNSANSLVVNDRLVTKVYFPRLVLPLAAVGAGLVDFAIAFVVLLGLMFSYGIVPTRALVLLPAFVLLAIAAAAAAGVGLSALNVHYRDVRHMLPFLTQFWMFATPIAYPSSLLSETWRVIYGLNPMAGVVEAFRWALLGRPQPPGAMLWVSSLAVVVGLWFSVRYFLRLERTLADVI